MLGEVGLGIFCSTCPFSLSYFFCPLLRLRTKSCLRHSSNHPPTSHPSTILCQSSNRPINQVIVTGDKFNDKIYFRHVNGVPGTSVFEKFNQLQKVCMHMCLCTSNFLHDAVNL